MKVDRIQKGWVSCTNGSVIEKRERVREAKEVNHIGIVYVTLVRQDDVPFWDRAVS